jgi:hypothetical protein
MSYKELIQYSCFIPLVYNVHVHVFVVAIYLLTSVAWPTVLLCNAVLFSLFLFRSCKQKFPNGAGLTDTRRCCVQVCVCRSSLQEKAKIDNRRDHGTCCACDYVHKGLHLQCRDVSIPPRAYGVFGAEINIIVSLALCFEAFSVLFTSSPPLSLSLSLSMSSNGFCHLPSGIVGEKMTRQVKGDTNTSSEAGLEALKGDDLKRWQARKDRHC